MTTAPLKSVEDSFILTLFDLVNHLTRNGERIVQTEGLTVQQWLLMLQIAGDPNFPYPDDATGPVLASALASARGVSRPSVSSLVTPLVQKGLIAQGEDPADRRQKTLRLTRAGRETLDRIEPRRRRANALLLGEFSERELTDALQVLSRCLTALRTLTPSAGGAASQVK